MEATGRTYKHWTTKEDFRLIELREKGLKYRKIALALGRSTISVEKRYRKILNEKIYI